MNACVTISGINPCKTKTCDDALRNGTNIIENEIQTLLVGTYKALQQQMFSGAHVAVIGYPQFWNAATDQCDTADWSVLKDFPNLMLKSKRQAMNNLTVLMNQKIEAAVQELNDPRFSFIDVDPFFEGHRFCEDGITEPQKSGDDRPDLFIHQWHTPTGQFDGALLN
jgi:hypothetical protein